MCLRFAVCSSLAECLWIIFSHIMPHLFKCMFVFICVCECVCVCVHRSACRFSALHFCIRVSAWLSLHPNIPTHCWEVRSRFSRDALLNSLHLKEEEEKSWLNAQKYSMSLASALLSALFLILTYCGKENPAHQDMDKELSSLLG